jgi:uncharacterized protein YfdQ (DUF2303 family)
MIPNSLDYDTAEDAAAIIASVHTLTLEAARPEPIGEDAPFIFGVTIPNGDTHKVLDLEQYALQPRRKIAHATFTETESLAWYVNTHRIDGTTLYANPELGTITAIIDDHAAGSPGHRGHTAQLKLRRTPGCERWLNAHARYLNQEEFAQLIEDGLTEIARPAGAELLEVAQSITATKSASFRSDRRLATGRVQFAWHEELDASAGASGELSIPEIVTLVFEPFYGAKPVQIDARFRYRLAAGKLTLGFWLVRHEEALRDAFAAEIERLEGMIEGADGDLRVLWGAA